MDKILGWRWRLGYVVAASVVGCTLSFTLSTGVYLALLIIDELFKVFWRIVTYYQQFKLGPEVAILISVGISSCLLLTYLLQYSKKMTKKF